MCDKCKRSNQIVVCHRPWSILWSIVQVCSLTIEYQVVQYVPSISISEQFESILLKILLQISFLLLWSGGHRCREWILCRVVESSCLPTHNIVPHISWHDQIRIFPSIVIFQFSHFTPSFEYIQSIHDQGKMMVLPNRLLYWVLSTSDKYFVSFQPIWCHPHTKIRITLFRGVRRSISSWKLSPNHISIGFSQIAFSHNSPPKGFPYKFLSRKTTGSSILDHDFGHLCRGRRIQMSGHSRYLEFSIIFWSIFHFDLGIRRYCVCCFSIATRQSGDDIHDSCCRHLWCWWPLFSEYCIRSRIIFYNVASENISTLEFLVSCLHFVIFQMTYVHQWCKMNFCALRPCFIDQLWFTSDFRQVPRRYIFKFLPFLITLFLLRVSS